MAGSLNKIREIPKKKLDVLLTNSDTPDSLVVSLIRISYVLCSFRVRPGKCFFGTRRVFCGYDGLFVVISFFLSCCSVGYG